MNPSEGLPDAPHTCHFVYFPVGPDSWRPPQLFNSTRAGGLDILRHRPFSSRLNQHPLIDLEIEVHVQDFEHGLPHAPECLQQDRVDPR